MRLFLIFFLLFVFLQCNSQTWERFFGEENRNDIGVEVVETYDKGFLLFGEYENDWGWIIKTDVNGNYLWDKIINCEHGLGGLYGMTKTMDGGVVLVGGAGIFENIINPFILKLNPCGEKEWCRLLRKEGDLAFANQVVEMEDGSLRVLTWYMGDFYEQMHLYSFSMDGDILWKKPFASTNDHPLLASPQGRTISKTSDGGLVVSGNCYYPDPWNPGGVFTIRPMFVKMDSFGTEEWLLPFGLNDTISGFGSTIVESTEHVFFGLGTLWGNNPDRLFPLICIMDDLGNELGYDILAIDTLFNNCYDSYFDNFGEIITDSLIFAQVPHNYNLADPTEGGEIIYNYQSKTLLLTKKRELSSSPYILKKTFDGKYIQNSSTLEINNIYKDMYLYKINQSLEFDTIYPGIYNYDSLCPNLPILPGFISLNDCEVITSAEEIPTPQQYYARIKTIPITVYPNPATDRVHFKLENTEHNKNIRLTCFNLLGTEVYHTSIIPGQKEAAADVSSWQEGMYMVVVYSEGKVAGRAKMVVWK